MSQDPDIYDKLTVSIAPSIWELDDVKRGILCQLFGGTSKVPGPALRPMQLPMCLRTMLASRCPHGD